MLDLLVSAALAGGAEAARILPSATIANDKGGGDFATTADISAQAAALPILEKGAPGIQIIAEESENEKILPPTFFTVDPFDGTIIGSRGAKEWGFLAAYVENGQPHAGVLYQPILDILVETERGKGCWVGTSKSRRQKQLRFPQSKKRLADGIVISYDINYTATAIHFERFLLPLVNTRKILVARGMCAAVANIIELLFSTTDVYLNPSGGKIWDYAAGALAVQEAGGTAISFHGDAFKPRPFSSEELAMSIMFAQTPELAQDLLDVWGLKIQAS